MSRFIITVEVETALALSDMFPDEVEAAETRGETFEPTKEDFERVLDEVLTVGSLIDEWTLPATAIIRDRATRLRAQLDGPYGDWVIARPATSASDTEGQEEQA